MKFSKSIIFALGLSLASASLSSCTDKDDTNTFTPFYYDYTFEVLQSNMFTEQGYYTGVFNADDNIYFLYPDLYLSHSAGSDTYDGVEYKWWKGFTFSRSTDRADHSDGNWTDYQWGAITGFGANASTIYGLGFWDTQESLTQVPEKPSCVFTFSVPATPQSICITNSAYTYYSMLNGSAFNRKFTESDYLTLLIKGVKNGAITNVVKVDLAAHGQILNTWKMVDLTPLGECTNIYFQMESSDTGQWGMNVPAYFCFDSFNIFYGSATLQ